MSLFLSPTVVMPQCLSQAAIWSRSQELAPKVRTFFVSRSAGTQTTWLSEWTSMPAALSKRVPTLILRRDRPPLESDSGVSFLLDGISDRNGFVLSDVTR